MISTAAKLALVPLERKMEDKQAMASTTEWGLEPPTPVNLHNQAMGGGGFTSLLYNPTVKDQLRFDGGVRMDYYQVPNDPEPTTVGYNDRQREQDIAAIGTWVPYFHTSARNFFDHDSLGNSNIFLPLTIQGAIIMLETTVRAPLLMHHYYAHLVYSNQTAQGVGGVTGGLTDFSPPTDGTFYLDHDQRNTLSAGMEGDLPWRCFGAVTINYGSGFLNGDGPSHLPSYYTLDLSLGKNFGESFTVKFVGTNITNQRYMLDTSNTFGGSHYADPRLLAVQIRYRFHY
jgi:outer membrane receptor protein involved in Fe transport